MIRLVRSNPPIFEFEVQMGSQLCVVKLKALYWLQFDEASRKDKLQTSIERFATYKSFDQWLGCFDYQLLDQWAADQKLIVGNADGLIARQDLLGIYEITGPALNYRIENMGHPKPIIVGRKQWFKTDECDQWIADQKTK
jgi:hypothetical protein